MFEAEKNGYKKTEVDYYIRRLEDDFRAILENNAQKLEHTRANLKQVTQVVPQFKSEIESLRERLENIRDCANQTSESRYLDGAKPEVLLANLITTVLDETAEMEKLKPVIEEVADDDFFEILAGSKELKLAEALQGFEFYDNNPYKAKAEKKLVKIKEKRERRAK